MDTYFRKVAKEIPIQQPETQQAKNKNNVQNRKIHNRPRFRTRRQEIPFEAQTLDKSLGKLPPETQQI